MEAQLQEMGVHSAEALRSIPLHILVDTFGERLARMLSRLCWGKVGGARAVLVGW